MGYRLLSGYFEYTSDVSLAKKIDNSGYNEAELIELKTPLHAPYLATNSTDFERVDGEIELGGKHYRYVKRKVEDGQLVLLCLPDEKKTDIQNARVEVFKLINDIDQSSSQSKSKNSASFKNTTTDYKQEVNSWSIAAWVVVQPKTFVGNNVSVSEGYDVIHKQPPRA